MRRAILSVLIVAVAACRATPPEPASISFRTDAPTCGSMRVERSVDGVLIARDYLTHGIPTPPVMVSAGTHTVSAKSLYFNSDAPVYSWPDTTYTLVEGQHVTRILPLYCS
jgi:hypothetical protein